MTFMRSRLPVFFSLICLSFSLSGQELTNKDASMESWEYSYPVKKVTLFDSLQVAYVDEGQGPVLLFVHGLGSNLQAWYKNLDSLQLTHRCIALDLPGYGKSDEVRHPYSMHFFAATLRAFIAELELEEVTLVGHSMGGQIAMHTVLASTENISRLVLVAPAGFETFTEQQQQWFATYVTPAVVKATPDAQIVRNFEINFHDMPDDARFMIDDRMELKASLAYEAYSEMIPQCVSAMLKEPVFDRLTEIKLPTLVVFGAEDALIPNRFLHPGLSVEEVAQAGVGQLSQAQLTILPAAGHFVQWEQAAELNKLITAFTGK